MSKKLTKMIKIIDPVIVDAFEWLEANGIYIIFETLQTVFTSDDVDDFFELRVVSHPKMNSDNERPEDFLTRCLIEALRTISGTDDINKPHVPFLRIDESKARKLVEDYLKEHGQPIISEG